MNIDLSSIVALLSGINPTAAAIVAAVVFVIQHVVNKQGGNFSLAGLLNLLSSWFSKSPATPAVPSPVVPAVPSAPSSDPLANRPILSGLRDILSNLFSQSVTSKLAATGDHTQAVGLFQKVHDALSDAKGEATGPFVGLPASAPTAPSSK